MVAVSLTTDVASGTVAIVKGARSGKFLKVAKLNRVFRVFRAFRSVKFVKVLLQAADIIYQTQLLISRIFIIIPMIIRLVPII